MPPSFEYHHIVGFEETNLVGNVYYVNHLRWQGRCREMFLRDHAPDVLAALTEDLRLVTLHCSCDYLAELRAFDRIVVRMRLLDQVQNRLKLGFEYVRREEGGEAVVARGVQDIACMTAKDGRLTPTPIPPTLRRALEPYSEQ